MKLAALILLATTTTAMADDAAPIDVHVDLGELGAIAFVELPPLMFGAIDALKRPTNKVYGGVEAAWGAGALAFNVYAFVDDARRFGLDASDYAVLGGLALVDGAVVAHGVYTIARRRSAERVTIAPVVVRGGLGVVGRF